MPGVGPDAHTLSALIEQCRRWKGDDVLLEDETESLTASATLDATSRVAAGLTSLGIDRGDRVAFLVGSSVRQAVSFFACTQIGAIPCALHSRDTPDRLAEVVDWLGAYHLVTDEERFALAQEIRTRRSHTKTIMLGDSDDQAGDAAFQDLLSHNPNGGSAAVQPDDVAYIILSSGTTGSPKGIVHLHRTAWAAAMSGCALYGDIGRSDRLLLPMGPSFAAWVNLALPFLGCRATLVFRRSFDPVTYCETLEEAAISYAALPPTLWRLALRAGGGGHDLSGVRYVFFSGEPGSSDLIHELLAVFPNASIRQAYLSSEGGSAAGVVAGHDLLVGSSKPTAAGLPIPGAELRVVPHGGPVDEPLPDDETGEIALTADSLAVRYWQDHELTSQRFDKGWWLSGDVGFRDPDGHVFIVGRTDNLINTGGVKVHAEEVEAALLSHADVELAAVIGVPDDKWGTAIEAHVVSRRSDLSEDELISYCRSLPALPGYKVPKRIVFDQALPTTPTGKIYRRGLRGALDTPPS